MNNQVEKLANEILSFDFEYLKSDSSLVYENYSKLKNSIASKIMKLTGDNRETLIEKVGSKSVSYFNSLKVDFSQPKVENSKNFRSKVFKLAHKLRKESNWNFSEKNISMKSALKKAWAIYKNLELFSINNGLRLRISENKWFSIVDCKVLKIEDSGLITLLGYEGEKRTIEPSNLYNIAL